MGLVKKSISGVSILYKMRGQNHAADRINLGVGTIMFQTILLDNRPPPGPRPVVKGVRVEDAGDKFKAELGRKLIPALGKGYTYGKALVLEGRGDDYSEALIATVLWCLMREPKHRCSSKELVSRIEKVIEEKYGLEDEKWKADRDAGKRAEREKLQEEQKKAAEERAYEEKLAALIKTQPQHKVHMMRMREEIVQEELDEEAMVKKLKEDACREREEELRENPPPLWVEKNLTNDPDHTYWINTKTGVHSWDDPWEDPPRNRTNMAGMVRPLLEASPLEQPWVNNYEEYQNSWRRVWRRPDTGEVTYVEPEICRQWREWYRLYWRQMYNDPRIELPPRPEKQEFIDISQQESEKRLQQEGSYIFTWWDIPG